MTDCTLDSSVVDWIIENPETMRLFEELGIDCSCGGTSLEYAGRQVWNRMTYSRDCIGSSMARRAHDDPHSEQVRTMN